MDNREGLLKIQDTYSHAVFKKHPNRDYTDTHKESTRNPARNLHGIACVAICDLLAVYKNLQYNVTRY